MNIRITYVANVLLTCAMVVFFLTTCGGCTTEQLEHAQGVVAVVKPGIDAAAPVVSSQPWYVFVLLSADIASSVLAAWIAFQKKKETK